MAPASKRTGSRGPGRIKAVILAGGLGTRLRPYTLFVPKPLLPVGNRPIIELIVEWLRANGITEIVIATGYLGTMIEDRLLDGSSLGVSIEYATSDKPLGIAGQLRRAAPFLPSRFVCLYGDAILDFDLRKLIAFHRSRKGALLTMALMKETITSRYGVIDTDTEGRITRWREKPVIENDINVGCYVMEKRYLDYIPGDSVYGMKEAFEKAMARREPLYGLKVEGEFYDIGDRAAYRAADAHFSERDGKVP